MRLATIVLVLTLCPVAHATPAAANIWATSDVLTAIRVADAHWPQSPCYHQETITWVAELDSTPDEQTAGLTVPGTCAITIAWGAFKAHRAPALLCTILEHEFGHAAGLAHSLNPQSVMFADPWVYAPDCRDALPLGRFTHGRICKLRVGLPACYAII